MRQLLLILNPTSGMRKGQKSLSDIISVFNQAGYDTHVYITREQGDCTRVVCNQGRNMDKIVCCGGDGTLNETISGVIQAGLDTPIGYIPAGSTNDFASSLKLPENVVDAAEAIVHGSARYYDVGKFANQYFSYIASFGAFTGTSYTTPQNMKNVLGHAAYVLGGIQELSKIHKEHIRMETDEDSLEGDFLFGAICNSTSVGGVLTLNPSMVDMSDGKFEILLIRGPKDLQELRECEAALRTQTYNCGMITFRKASQIDVFSDSAMTWTLDGERAEGASSIHIENMRQRIRLVH